MRSYVQVTDEDVAAIEELGRQGGLFERLAASIAPEIFGMLDVKKVGAFAGPCTALCCAVLRCALWLVTLAQCGIVKQLVSVWKDHTAADCMVVRLLMSSLQALLLQMVGGVSQEFPGTGMKLRGDIHVCLMGDPGEQHTAVCLP